MRSCRHRSLAVWAIGLACTIAVSRAASPISPESNLQDEEAGAYGISTAIGFSLVSTSSHFPSDAFFGGAIGYAIGRFAVLHQ